VTGQPCNETRVFCESLDDREKKLQLEAIWNFKDDNSCILIWRIVLHVTEIVIARQDAKCICLSVGGDVGIRSGAHANVANID
jgi:hypothetical protein